MWVRVSVATPLSRWTRWGPPTWRSSLLAVSGKLSFSLDLNYFYQHFLKGSISFNVNCSPIVHVIQIWVSVTGNFVPTGRESKLSWAGGRWWDTRARKLKHSHNTNLKLEISIFHSLIDLTRVRMLMVVVRFTSRSTLPGSIWRWGTSWPWWTLATSPPASTTSSPSYKPLLLKIKCLVETVVWCGVQCPRYLCLCNEGSEAKYSPVSVLTSDRRVTVKHCLALPSQRKLLNPHQWSSSWCTNRSQWSSSWCSNRWQSPLPIRTTLTTLTGLVERPTSLMIWLEITRLTDWMFCKHAGPDRASEWWVWALWRKKNQTKCRLVSSRGNYNVMNSLLSGRQNYLPARPDWPDIYTSLLSLQLYREIIIRSHIKPCPVVSPQGTTQKWKKIIPKDLNATLLGHPSAPSILHKWRLLMKQPQKGQQLSMDVLKGKASKYWLSYLEKDSGLTLDMIIWESQWLTRGG